MRQGDMVRFAKWGEFDLNDPWDKAEKRHIGILVEHDKLMRMCWVLHMGELLHIRQQLVEKAGKKDFVPSPDCEHASQPEDPDALWLLWGDI